MREIKFRTWDKNCKKMSMPFGFNAHPRFETTHNGEYAISTIKPSDWLGFNANNENERLIAMQYTGLKDKDCIEIYEGDIVNTSLFGKCEVRYFHNAFVLWSNGSYDRSFNNYLYDNVKVIGNIYEHPHLLEEDKK